MSSDARRAALTLRERLHPTYGLTTEEVDLLLAPYYERADRLVKLLLLIHFTLTIALAPIRQTWVVSAVVSLTCLVLFFASAAVAPRSLLTRCVGGLALQAFVALHVYQVQQVPEMCFLFFIAQALLIAYYDWRVLWPGLLLFVALTLLPDGITFGGGPLEPARLALFVGLALVMGAVGSYWSVRMRQQVVQQKWQSNEMVRMAQIARNAGESIILTDKEGKITWVNESFTRLTGYADAEAAGKDLFHLLHGERTDAALVEKMRTALRTGESISAELYLYGREAKECWVARSITPLSSRFGADGGAVVIDMDGTARKRAEEERAALDERLQEAQRLDSLGVLAGGIAHDFNNLLTAIMGYASLTDMLLAYDSPGHEYLKEIELAGRRAADLCKQMLAFAGKGQFVISLVDVAGVVAETLELLRGNVARAVQLDADPGDNLPRIEADRTQIQQIVMNLVLNAAEAIGDKPGRVIVRTRTVRGDRAALDKARLGAELAEGEYLLLEVIDTGCGMDDGTQARMYDPFFSTKFAGRGLGLAAVLGIVRSHRGALAVHSVVGAGTTFGLYFPVAREVQPSRPKLLPSADGWRGEGHVLVVDDEAPVRNVTVELLRDLGFDVLAAGEGQEALDILSQQANGVRLMLLDLTMPRMTGEQVLERTCQLYPDLIVIVMSGYGETEMRRRMGSLPRAGFLAKPFTAVELRRAVRAALAAKISSARS